MSLIVFNFCDNDFHSPLREAVTFLTDNLNITTMTVEAIKKATIGALQAFSTLRDISKDRDIKDHTDYFGSTLSIFEISSFKALEARNQGEGYAYDTRTKVISYWGYY